MATEKQKALFVYLKDAQAKGNSFDIATIAKVTGWKESSTRTTLRSRHYASVVKQVDSNKYVATIDPEMSLEDFVQAISQSSKVVTTRPDINSRMPLVTHLIQDARDAFILALELFNRPSISNKHGPFAVVMGMAWEKLLKARLVEIEGEEQVFLPDGNTIGFEKCIVRVFPDPNNNIRKNLLELKEMRDGTIHFLVPEIGSLTTPFFQAAVINFRKCYEEWTSEELISSTSSGLMSLVVVNEPVSTAQLRKLYGEQFSKVLQHYADNLNGKIEENSSEEYHIAVEVSLRQVKKVEEADLKVWNSKDPIGIKLIPDPTAVDSTVGYQYRPKVAKDRINEKLKELGVTEQLTINSFNAIVYKAKLKGDRKYHRYDPLGLYHAYSQAAIDKIVELIRHGRDYIQTAVIAHQKSQRKGH